MTSNAVLVYRTRVKHSSIFILAIPLTISAFTHIWNPIGFPAIHPDEGTYMRRAMHVLEGLGAQDPASQFDHSQFSTSSYDHPYFGQIFLASMLNIIGYPDFSSFHDNNTQSIDILYMTPRILMGLLAVFDTFLVYKITARLYGNKVALVASILFAVMPLSWLLRRIVLDSIMLPLVLTSIYFLISYTKNSFPKNYEHGNRKSSENLVMILISGIFLGLAIFTKLPAFSIIPLAGVLFLINNPDERRWKFLGLWLIPVVSIPLIWPAYAISTGDFDEWLGGVLWQGSQRQEDDGKTLKDIVEIFFRIDPVLFLLGLAGFVYSALKKDFFPLVWAGPYISLMYVVGWATHFHWILVLPIFCISVASILLGSRRWLHNNRRAALRLLPYFAISAISVFALVSITMLITSNLSLAQFQAAAFVSHDIQRTVRDTTVISSPVYSWIFKYILDRDHVFAHLRDSSQPLQTNQILLIIDATFFHVLGNEGEDIKQIELIKMIRNNTYPIASFRDTVIRYDMKDYPYTNMREADIGGGQIVVQANY